MIKLNLTPQNKQEELILNYIQNHASDTLAEKINNGTPIEKDGKPLINKKALSDFMKYACDEAKKLAKTGEHSAFLEDAVVYGWAIHYFEEDSIEGTLYNPDGTKYKSITKQKNIKKSTYSPTSSKKKEENKQANLFDMLSQDNNTVDTKINDTNEPTEEDLRDADEIVANETTIATEKKTEEKNSPKVSPVYTEYSELKEKYTDCVIAYRLGDFYEILGKDAVTIATELDLTLTGRDCGLSRRIPMVGFPYHAADNYIAKIIEHGHKIAIVEKSDDVNILPKEKFHEVDEETGEILSEEEMREFDGDIEEPSELEEKYTIKENHDYTLAEKKEFAKAFDNETVCKLSELLGDCFILA